MALEHKNAAGTFIDRQHTESALSQLKAADFPMNKVSIVAEHVNSNAIFLPRRRLTPEHPLHLSQNDSGLTQTNPVFTKNRLFRNQIRTKKPVWWHMVRKS